MSSLITIYVWEYSTCRKLAQLSVYVNESNFLPKEIKMKQITFWLESSFIKCHAEIKRYLFVP